MVKVKLDIPDKIKRDMKKCYAKNYRMMNGQR